MKGFKSVTFQFKTEREENSEHTENSTKKIDEIKIAIKLTNS
jgi:hypothetical protein